MKRDRFLTGAARIRLFTHVLRNSSPPANGCVERVNGPKRSAGATTWPERARPKGRVSPAAVEEGERNPPYPYDVTISGRTRVVQDGQEVLPEEKQCDHWHTIGQKWYSLVMLTLTSNYALRAMIYLAQHEADWPITSRCIAAQANIPGKYLSKVLGDLVRVGVLSASPGKSGGFRLRRPARATVLYEVLSPFEQLDQKRCPFGNQECSGEQPCLAHNRWSKVLETQQRFLRKTSIHDVAFEATPRRRAVRRKR